MRGLIEVKFEVVILLMFFPIAAGCFKGAVEEREPLPDIVWPKPPEIPRIRLINSVSKPEDLRVQGGRFRRFFDYLAGNPEKSMVAPYGVETDSWGRLYVVDTFLKIVHVFDAKADRYYTFPTRNTSFLSPIDIAIDSEAGLIYVSDSKEGVVKVFKEGGKVFVAEMGKGTFQRPTGIAINRITSELLVVDTLSGNIYAYALGDHHVKGVIGGSGGEGEARFHYPTNIFVSRDGQILVSDSLNFRVQVFSSDGKLLRKFGSLGDNPGYFTRPKGVAADSEGNIYVVDALFDNVQIFDAEGRLLMAFGEHGKGFGEFWLPTGIFIDGNDRIYVSDSYNRRVQIFQYLKEGLLLR